MEKGIVEKSPEQIKAERLERFTSNPDDFVCTDDLICAVIKGPKGMTVYLGTCTRNEYEIAQSRLNYKINKVFDYIEAEFMAKNKSVIQTANGKSPIDFARGK